MTIVSSPRAVVRQLAAGPRSGTLAIPLALHVAARIQERDPEEFLYDATQLANALRDLADAVDPDGVPVTCADLILAACPSIPALLGSEQLSAAAEATRRLRASFGDRLALLAGLPGPAAVAAATGGTPAAAADAVLALGKEFLAAGADVLLVEEDTELTGAAMSTLANVARFHQAVTVAHGAPRYGLPGTTLVPLSEAVPGTGVVTTPEHLPRETDIGLLRDWVSTVRGG